MSNRLGAQTIKFPSRPRIYAASSIVGPKEGEGPLGKQFDQVLADYLAGQKTAEKAERYYLELAAKLALAKAHLTADAIDVFIAGDLLNQIVSASFVARTIGCPFIGLYAACATSSKSLALAAMMVEGGFAGKVLVGASSHYQTAERQFRYPIEFNVQRRPTAQWTVTGAASFVIGAGDLGPCITEATIGRVVDLGCKDPNDMGSAMAPAAFDTIQKHLADTGRQPTDYDLILTGDLARVGSSMLYGLCQTNGLELAGRHQDAGNLIYRADQDVVSGGSGCACSAVTIAGPVFRRLQAGELRRVMIVATGALFSTLTYQQGETIPCVAHAVSIEGV
ncbi:MAG: stage V sporulation protein AD [Bacteroidota bacterium]